MQNVELEHIVIVGGGTAGWMTAAALARTLNTDTTKVTLIESDSIGSIGVGEATIPHIRDFNAMLGIGEAEFLQATKGTYKLGIEFTGWGKEDSRYFHPFSDFGLGQGPIPFHLQWLRGKDQGLKLNLDQFSICAQAAWKERFQSPSPNGDPVLSEYSYAYHLDATAYARYLRQYSETRGVQRREGIIKSVSMCSQTGNIKAVKLENGLDIEGELFIDCSGFASLLINRSLNVGYEDWSHWLPCNRAVAQQTQAQSAALPYTKSIANKAGWQWYIPLQHRNGNGVVYCSEYMNDDEAQALLQANGEEPLNAPRVIRFTAGMRRECWHRNCVAIGLSSGFLEPLESTSIYLIQVGIYKLLELLPQRNSLAEDAQVFNQLLKDEYCNIRDFIIMHYKLNQRKDSEFWQHCQAMDIPDSLQYRLDIFKNTGHLPEVTTGLGRPSWHAIMYGQGFLPEVRDLRLNTVSPKELKLFLEQVHHKIDEASKAMPSHEKILRDLGSTR